MENQFLPEGYEAPASGGKYMKFADGDNKFRVLSSAIVGWLDWDNNTPIRTKEQPESAIDPNRPPKHFWAFVVWDYQANAVKILEITQVGIRESIMALVNNPDWGDPKNFDITVNRTGQKLETRYNVISSPPKPLDQLALETYQAINVDLEKLYSNGDPFGGNGQAETVDQSQTQREKEIAEIDAEKTGGIDPEKVPM